MQSNTQLIERLISAGILRSPSLIDAFIKCDRALFVPDEYRQYAYEDRPLPISNAQTISQPYTVAIMLELLQPHSGDKVLDIGSGSGWTSALLATAVGMSGFVQGVEIVPSLVEYGKKNVEKAGIRNVDIELSDPTILGKPGEMFDRILVSASAPKMPKMLFNQLKAGGKLVVPVENSIWSITKYEDESIDAYELPGFQFVPLIV